MEREINFVIKEGVYCSWCAELMKKALMQHFAIKDVKINIPEEKARVISYKKLNAKDIISFLKKRGYLIEESY